METNCYLKKQPKNHPFYPSETDKPLEKTLLPICTHFSPPINPIESFGHQTRLQLQGSQIYETMKLHYRCSNKTTKKAELNQIDSLIRGPKKFPSSRHTRHFNHLDSRRVRAVRIRRRKKTSSQKGPFPYFCFHFFPSPGPRQHKTQREMEINERD